MLKEFFDHFETHADVSVRQLWRYENYETKFGNRQEMSFIGSSMILFELPEGSFDFMVIQTQEVRIYKHASYMLSLFAEYALKDDDKPIEVRLYGQGYQPFVGVHNAKVEPLNAIGTVIRETMFGEQKEHVVSRIDRVRLSRKGT
jgi:hypothetical protein